MDCAVSAGPGDSEERVTDIHSLVVRPDGSLLWSNCDVPARTDQMPEGAHSIACVAPLGTVRLLTYITVGTVCKQSLPLLLCREAELGESCSIW